MEGDSSV